MSEGMGLLSSIQALLSLPVVSGHKILFRSCNSFLEELMSQKSGILHLMSNLDSMIHCIHHLMKSSPSLNVEDPGSAGHLGVKLAFHIQAMQSIDHICSHLESDADEEDIEEELSHSFKMINSLTYPSFGKNFVFRIFAMEDNLRPILRCLWFPRKLSDPDPVIEEEKNEDKKQSIDLDKEDPDGSDSKEEIKPEAIQHRTALNSYAASVLQLVLERSSDVGFIYRYKADIFRSCMSKLHVNAKSDFMKLYLKPLEKELTGEKSDIEKLVNLIREEAALLDWTALAFQGPGICTSLKLLSHLCLKGGLKGAGKDPNSRLAVIELFSVDALNILLSLADQLHKAIHNHCHGIRPMAAFLTQSTHTLVVSISQNIADSVHKMLLQLLDSSVESKNVNGTQVVKSMVALYSDLFILLQPLDAPMLHELTEKFVSIISLFFAHASCSDQTNSIVSEIIQLAESQCDKFAATLTLLSQLLPMPLPFVSPREPPDSVRAAALASCKLWSTAMTPHVDRLCFLIFPLSSSTCRPLIKVLVVVMQHVFDLSPSFASTLCSKYMEEISPLLVSTVIGNEDDMEIIPDDDSGEKELMLSPEQVTMIQTFSEIMSLPAARTAVICQMVTEEDGLLDLWNYASNADTPKEDIAAVLIFTTILLDTEYALLPVGEDLQSLTNCLPPLEYIKSIISFALGHMASPFPVVQNLVFVVLGLLLKIRYTFPYVRNALVKGDAKLLNSCKQMLDKFNSSDNHCINAVLSMLEFLEIIIDPACQQDDDKFCLNKDELSWFLDWDKDNTQHPLRLLESKLAILYQKDVDFCDEDIDYALDNLTALRQSLDCCNKMDAKPPPILKETGLPKPLSLADQFSERPVFVIGQEDTMLYTWMSLTNVCAPSSYPDADDDQRVVQCDLIATAEKFCPGYDLPEELNKLANAVEVQQSTESAEAIAKRRQKMETYSARLGKSLTFMKRSHGLLMTQQKVGRRRGRGRGSATNRPYDLFRHRKQNTSPPPSMHVDDFVAADEEQEKVEDDPSIFKPPSIPAPAQVNRRPQLPSFKQREFTPRGRGGRGGRGGSYRPRGGFNHQGTGANNTPLNRFRGKMSGNGGRGRNQDRYQGTSRMTSRLSYSPRDGFKTNKSEQGGWSGGFNREYQSGGSPSFRGRGAKVSKGRGGYYFTSPGTKQWTPNSSFQRRGRGYNKQRGKHIRSFTR
ncbi:protein virilizer homolog [Clavelina lepadiformis]|uniref:protein virilizer homolog n=1 Tax=Clavelina lepadiformis TaxID=159417 RepID=UPI00404281EA